MEVKNDQVVQAYDLVEKFGLCDFCREICCMADWYLDQKSPTLSEYCRYAHRTVFDFIDSILAECATVEDILALIEQKKYFFWNEYKFYQSEGFMHFAELAMVAKITFSRLESHIRQNINSKAVPNE